MVTLARSEPAVLAPARRWTLATLYAETFAFVHRALGRAGVAPPDLPDLVHEVYVIAHRRERVWVEREDPRGWLLGIAWRVASQHRRTERRRQRRHEGLDALPPAEATLEDTLLRQRLTELLVGLDRRCREAFVLTQLEGLTAEEAARTLDVAPSTVHSRVARARARLVRRLSREGGRP